MSERCSQYVLIAAGWKPFVIPGGGARAADPEPGGAGAQRRRSGSVSGVRDSFALPRAALFRVSAARRPEWRKSGWDGRTVRRLTPTAPSDPHPALRATFSQWEKEASDRPRRPEHTPSSGKTVRTPARSSRTGPTAAPMSSSTPRPGTPGGEETGGPRGDAGVFVHWSKQGVHTPWRDTEARSGRIRQNSPRSPNDDGQR
jgi:hypothetical protein